MTTVWLFAVVRNVTAFFIGRLEETTDRSPGLEHVEFSPVTSDGILRLAVRR